MLATLERCNTPESFNALVNHPAIRPHVWGDPKLPLDMTRIMENDMNVFLMGEHGGFVLIWCGPRCYEVHTMIRPAGLGRWALAAARECIRTVFEDLGAKHLWTRVRSVALNVRQFTVVAGLVPCGEAVFDFGVGPEAFNLYERRA